MQLNSFHPVLLVEDVAAARDFFVAWFAFEPVFDNGWYASLRHTTLEATELAIMQAGHESIPSARRATAAGLLLNFEVEDAAAEWERLRDCGAAVLTPLRDEAWGQRHFILAGPGGTMIDVIEALDPPSE